MYQLSCALLRSYMTNDRVQIFTLGVISICGYTINQYLYVSLPGITEYKYPSDVSYQIIGILYTNTCMLVYLVLLDIQRVHASI